MVFDETFGGKFILRSIGIESVEIGYVDFPVEKKTRVPLGLTTTSTAESAPLSRSLKRAAQSWEPGLVVRASPVSVCRVAATTGGGIATGRFFVNRLERSEPRGAFSLAPLDRGVMLTYAVPIRR